MSWYRTGTIAVTNGSPTVVGVGTFWTQQVKAGDILFAPDSALYEITAVTDNTHLEIKQRNGTAAYAGATLSAQSYSILRNFTYSTNADLASRLATLVDGWQGSRDELAAWNAGTAGGGIYADGTYPMTAPDGTVTYVKCPAQLAADVATLDSIYDQLPSRAQFEATAAARRNQFAGSGFVEWGDTVGAGIASFDQINNLGFATRKSANAISNVIAFGGSVGGKPAKMAINGYQLSIGNTLGSSNYGLVPLPPAPATAALLDRQDLVFLEVWHEKTSDKDFIYPRGNTQFGEATYTPPGGAAINTVVPTGANFAGFDTYSLFGNWQAANALVGRGMKWSTMTATQQQQFLSDPENNCYLDGSEIIQVRYRVRVVEGLGSNWAYASPSKVVGGSSVFSYDTSYRIRPVGKNVTPEDLTVNTNSWYGGTDHANAATYKPGVRDVGIWYPGNATSSGYGGSCFAIPIALVQRRNSGAYHPVWNPNGSAKCLNVDGTTAAFWYATDRTYVSTADCFLYKSGGAIGGVSGRPDGLFYDEINERDVKDLRNSAHKVSDLRRPMEREFNRLVAATMRGWEQEHAFSTSGITGGYISGGLVNLYIYYTDQATRLAAGVRLGDVFLLTKGALASVVIVNATYVAADSKAVQASVLSGDPLSSYGAANSSMVGVTIIGKGRATYATKTLTHCDIIGNPANYPASWKTNGFAGTPRVMDDDGTTSIIPDGILDSFKLGRKASAAPLLVLRSTDSGATWAVVGSPTFSTTTNAITLTNEPAANLVLVFYSTPASALTYAANAESLSLGQVMASNSATTTEGAYLVAHAIGKVPVGTTAPTIIRGYTVRDHTLDSTYKLSTATTAKPLHTALTAFGTTASAAAKFLTDITRKNGKAFLKLHAKEIRHNGSSFGDDAKFAIQDNSATVTDNNALTCVSAQYEVELPYFIADGD